MYASFSLYCYHCGVLRENVIQFDDGPLSEFREAGWQPTERKQTVTGGEKYCYLCRTCLFDLVISGELVVAENRNGEIEWRKVGGWRCNGPSCPDREGHRVVYLSRTDFAFYCEVCLSNAVANGQLTLGIGTTAAAATGPTATFDQDTGAIEYEGVEFRW